MKKSISAILICISHFAFSQTSDRTTIRSIFDEALENGKSYEMLRQLTQNAGPRLSGSPDRGAGVEWSRTTLETFEFDSVWMQPVLVPHWIRGQKEIGRVTNSKGGIVEMNVCAIGGSVGTGPRGVIAKIIEVKSFDELDKLGTRNIRGKIVFFNRPMDPTRINTFAAYGGAVDQRGYGASMAAKYGAVAVVVRSMGLNQEDYPHTGGLRYDSAIVKIPAIAVSTWHAEQLSKMMKSEKDLEFYIETHC